MGSVFSSEVEQEHTTQSTVAKASPVRKSPAAAKKSTTKKTKVSAKKAPAKKTSTASKPASKKRKIVTAVEITPPPTSPSELSDDEVSEPEMVSDAETTSSVRSAGRKRGRPSTGGSKKSSAVSSKKSSAGKKKPVSAAKKQAPKSVKKASGSKRQTRSRK